MVVSDTANKASCILFAGVDGSCCVQVAECSIINKAEYAKILQDTTRNVDIQRMTVAIECTTVWILFVQSNGVFNTDVGIEAGIHIVLTLGGFHLVKEGLPVVCIADGEEEVRHLLQLVEGRLALLHIHLYIIGDAGAIAVHDCIAAGAVGLIQLYLLLLHDAAVAVLHGEVQDHLGAVVPHAATLVGIVPRHANGVGPLVLPLRCPVGDAQQVQVIYDARGVGGAVVFAAPTPVLGDDAAHAVGQLVQRAAILQHVGGDVLHQRAVDIGISGFLVARGVELLEDGDEVLLLARQRALNLEEVGGRHIAVVQIRHAPLQLHLALAVVQRPRGHGDGWMNHGQVHRLRCYVFNVIFTGSSCFLVAADDTEVTVRLGGIEDDDAAGGILDLLAMMLAVGIVVLIVRLGDLVGSQEPGHLNLARVVGIQHALRDGGHQLVAGGRHLDFRGLEARHFLFSAAVTVAHDVPGECQFLAQHVVGHHPLSAELEGLAIAVARQGLPAGIVLRQLEHATRIAQRDVEEGAGGGTEIARQRRVAVVDVLLGLPLENDLFRDAISRDLQAAKDNPAVGTLGVIGRSLEIDDVRAAERDLVVLFPIDVRVRRRRLWQQPGEERQQHHQPLLGSSELIRLVHKV